MDVNIEITLKILFFLLDIFSAGVETRFIYINLESEFVCNLDRNENYENRLVCDCPNSTQSSYSD